MKKTEKTVWWGDINIKFDPEKIRSLVWKSYFLFSGKNFVCTRCLCVCADPKYRLNIRVVTESPWQNLFANNLFLRPSNEEILKIQKSDWTILCAPDFTPIQNWMVLVRAILPSLISPRRLFSLVPVIPEKKSKRIFQFWILFYRTKKMFSMHCSANIGPAKETLQFSLVCPEQENNSFCRSNRGLIGDDEHGWAGRYSV